LLLRLYDIKQGEILIDGKSIFDYKLETLRSLFALVSQDIFLFNDSVEENVKAGEEISDEELNHALEVSYTNEFIKTLPDGIKTEIGDRGLKLSGGQSQRLTIARAFFKRLPRTLIR
jgi:ABC-type multidrug transport system fused ATPase/permease subunit